MDSRTKRIPERQCISCRGMRARNELIRIVKTDSEITLDPTGKMNGRGAYVCNKSECIKLLCERKGLDRSFKMHVSNDVYNSIFKEYLSEE